VGKALLVDQLHRDRGFEEGLSYHFLIDNGSLGKGNGQLEVAPRWLKQEQGAHCKAFQMNSKSIGIGLVGHFNEQKPSPAQMHTLIQLVAQLCSYYELSSSDVIPHRLVPGARTDCPGNLFPWKSFQLSLKSPLHHLTVESPNERCKLTRSI
jgi:N-acetylmuramoyl-L-alanine amidase